MPRISERKKNFFEQFECCTDLMRLYGLYHTRTWRCVFLAWIESFVQTKSSIGTKATFWFGGWVFANFYGITQPNDYGVVQEYNQWPDIIRVIIKYYGQYWFLISLLNNTWNSRNLSEIDWKRILCTNCSNCNNRVIMGGHHEYMIDHLYWRHWTTT